MDRIRRVNEKMTDILVKLFIKDYEKIDSDKVRTAYGVLASIVGILCNLLLFAGILILCMTVPAAIYQRTQKNSIIERLLC